jgi:hypothetical protein
MLDCELVNLSLAGSANSLIHDTTITELSKRQYDLVIIVWPESHHDAVKVKDITKFAGSPNTSLHQSSMNDWPEKQIIPVNDQDYVDKNWILSNAYQHHHDNVAQFFKDYFGAVGTSPLVESNLLKIISVQGFLKSINQPYLFLYGRSFTKFKKFDNLYRLIDWDNFYTEETLTEIASKNNNELMGSDDKYPNADGHRYYASLIADRIKAMKLDSE